MNGKTEIYLYRFLHVDQFPEGGLIGKNPVTGALYPDFERRMLPNGSMRPADVRLTKDGKSVVNNGGTSLFDKDKLFSRKTWSSFHLPDGTVVPESLRIKYTGKNERFDADHYQIHCAEGTMPIESFKGALDNLARNAVVRFNELAKGAKDRT
jgi:hypothetical protein